MDADEEALFAVSTLSPRREESPLLVFHGKTQPHYAVMHKKGRDWRPCFALWQDGAAQLEIKTCFGMLSVKSKHNRHDHHQPPLHSQEPFSAQLHSGLLRAERLVQSNEPASQRSPGLSIWGNASVQRERERNQEKRVARLYAWEITDVNTRLELNLFTNVKGNGGLCKQKKSKDSSSLLCKNKHI